MERKPPPPLELFFCYAQKDRVLRGELDKHLAGLRRSGRISTWYDEEIVPGTNQREEIKKRLGTAQIILLLISADFLSSDYCYEEEMKQAIERHYQGKTRVVPIYLRPCDYTHTPFSELKMLPSGERAITDWANRDRDAAFTIVAQGIQRVVEALYTDSSLLDQTPAQAIPFVKPARTPSASSRAGKEISFSKSSSGDNSPNPAITLAATTSSEAPVVASPSYPRVKLSRLKNWFVPVIGLSLIVFILVRLIPLIVGKGGFLQISSFASPATAISVSTTKQGERVGLSDGHFAFDTNQLHGKDKSEAAQKFASRDVQGAIQLWQKACKEDSSDAEALIYLEDQKVLASHKPYITLVVATILTGQNAQVGRDDLQGAYVAQKEFNGSSPAFLVRLLIANSGSGDESVAGKVAQQIVQAASQDKSIVGVMGWPFSESTLNAVNILAKAHLPLVSETASTDQLSGKSPYFFRIIPPNFQQSRANAVYVAQTLHAQRVALFIDPKNAYSSSFANDFMQSYLRENGTGSVAREEYTVGTQGQAKLSSLLQDALNTRPDVIYFAGYAADLTVLLNALPAEGPEASVPIVGGEGLYELGGYNQSARVHLGQVHFLSYAYPDEWDIAGLASQKPAFFQEYSSAFNPSGKASPGTYGFTRPDNDVIVSYDATRILLTASRSVTSTHITSDQLQYALAQIDDNHPFQGVSGRIAFGLDGNPINKPILLLSVDSQARFHEEALLSGCLLIDHCG